MDIKAIIEKLKKGESLNDDEKKFLAEYDHDKTINGAQAEARRKADEKLAAEVKEREKLAQQIADLNEKLKAKDGEKLSATEQLQRALADLQQKFEASEKRSVDLAAQQAKAARSAKVQDIAAKYGISYIDGVDVKLLSAGFEGAMSSVENLDDENVVKPLVESFKSANKAVIRDQSGGGGGTPPKDGSGASRKTEITPAERKVELQKAGIIS